MFKPNQSLLQRADLEAAMQQQIQVSVWEYGELYDDGGLIVNITKDAVKIGDDYYLIDLFDFRVI